MKVLITDLTRMKKGHICVAGIDMDTTRRVRPVGRYALEAKLLASRGGPLDIGRIIDIGNSVPCGVAPEIEDVEFDPRHIRVVSSMDESGFFGLLKKVPRADIASAIGPELKQIGRSLATPVGRGDCSLVIVARPRTTIMIDSYGKLRAPFPNVSLSVTDVRLYEEDDLLTPDATKVTNAMLAIRSSTEIMLSIGLAHAWQKPGDTELRHYVQLNNIHVKGWADWRLSPA